ncbi:serpentine type 7TM GPCR chemoreceptor srt domain-containing protein [Ditylenchus destructor]|nr:serpentine type 7TM GPCR chemoreceptor srt domain-containing protein [Ditylenchus destructor]
MDPWFPRKLFFQISIICFLTIISCLGYAYEGFFDQYKVLVTITADAYLLYLGSPAFVYLLLNKSILLISLRILEKPELPPHFKLQNPFKRPKANNVIEKDKKL